MTREIRSAVPGHQSTIITLLLMVTFVLPGCKTKDIPGQWTAQPIQVDGKSTDWAGLSLTHFEKDGFSIGVANDNDRLYLMMRTHDASIVRTIRMTGLKLWLNTKGDKETGFGVKFRGGPSFGLVRRPPDMQDQQRPEDRERPEMMEPRRPMRDTAMVFTFVDEAQLIDLDIPVDGKLGPAIAVDTSEGFYSYEFSIPLQESKVRYFGLGAEPAQKLAIDAIWGDVDRSEFGERRNGIHAGFGGEPPLTGGMPPGGGRGGGPPGGMGGGRRPEIKKVDVWFKTTLAVQ
jgi:hypothetical protein